MKRFVLLMVAIMVLVWVIPVCAGDNGYLFGTITTERGDRYTGRIRWDKNEGSWGDVLDATKYDDERYESRRKRRTGFKLFGLSIIRNNSDWDFWTSSSSQLRFGHIEAIAPRSRGRATVYLKNGEKVRFEDASSDLGSGIRGIVIDSEEEGIIELDWSDLDRVEFFPEPDGYRGDNERAERLYGVVETEGGETFTGAIVWDADEIYTTDILDGEEDGTDRKIRFGAIERIVKESRRGCIVHRKNGRTIELRGSNDVNSGNRGIFVILPSLGQVKIEWDEFESLTFMSPPEGAMMSYVQFDGGRRLYGTVVTEDGDRFTGTITWDNDERYSWEFLNGSMDDIEYDVEFAQIARIERRSSRSADVTLRDGTRLRLRGSNDVDDDNKGIFIETESGGDIIEVGWDEFEELILD